MTAFEEYYNKKLADSEKRSAEYMVEYSLRLRPYIREAATKLLEKFHEQPPVGYIWVEIGPDREIAWEVAQTQDFNQLFALTTTGHIIRTARSPLVSAELSSGDVFNLRAQRTFLGYVDIEELRDDSHNTELTTLHDGLVDAVTHVVGQSSAEADEWRDRYKSRTGQDLHDSRYYTPYRG
jgi:hypothetical protein